MKLLGKRIIFGVVFSLYTLLFLQQILAQAYLPHLTAGYIFTTGTTQVPLGTTFTINNTNNDYYLRSTTNIPVPGLTGRYSESINATDGEYVFVRAWNGTHYGYNNFTIVGDVDNVNVTLNMTRPGESNMSIIYPPNNTFIERGTIFNITANVSIIGALDAVTCTAIAELTNDFVFNFSVGEIINHSLGNITTGSFNFTIWSMNASGLGVTNITASSSCYNQTINLERLHSATSFNITVNDTLTPTVNLRTPVNNTLLTTNNGVFVFNVSDASSILNCSLVINNTINQSNQTDIVKNLDNTITQHMDEGTYNWSVQCIDEIGLIGQPSSYNLTVEVSGPLISNLVITNPIILSPGNTQEVWCNASVDSGNTGENINFVNATIYDTSASSLSAPDDNNDHYTNSACTNVSTAEGTTNYSCSFNMWYYSNNASWRCDLIATDTAALSTTENINGVVNELLSINSTSLIDYGVYEAGNVSNITNITLFNIGNIDVNISVRGFGQNDGDGLSMVCDSYDTSIPVNNHRFSSSFDANYTNMSSLQSTDISVNMTLFQRVLDNSHAFDANTTYWRINLGTPVAGPSCNGTLVMSATPTAG